MLKLKGLLAACLLTANGAAAHEFWIDPDDFTVEPGASLVADIRVGEAFEGAGYAYVPRNFSRFDLVSGDAVIPVDGRAGDRPALDMTAPDAGLVVVVHVTRDYTLTYTERETFVDFVTHKDFAWVLDSHEERGLPESGFKERYSRHAKSLIAVGEGAGEDRAVGLETEIVAQANPYTDDVSGGMPVRVLYQGAPRPDMQVELFERAPDGSVTISTTRTDSDGIALLSVKPGHVYLADHVVMRPIEPGDEGDPVWESLWASLTFAVPE